MKCIEVSGTEYVQGEGGVCVKPKAPLPDLAAVPSDELEPAAKCGQGECYSPLAAKCFAVDEETYFLGEGGVCIKPKLVPVPVPVPVTPPTDKPTPAPTTAPTAAPSPAPTSAPSPAPTAAPTGVACAEGECLHPVQGRCFRVGEEYFFAVDGATCAERKLAEEQKLAEEYDEDPCEDDECQRAAGDCVPLGSAYSRGEGGACVEAEAEGEDVECAAGECLDSDTGACATLGATYSLAMDGVTCAAAPTEPPTTTAAPTPAPTAAPTAATTAA